MKSVTKRDEIIQKMQDEARYENKFGWRRCTEYDNRQKEQFDKWKQQEDQRSQERS